MPKGKVLAWILYDWATSGYGAIIGTFVFSVYFTQEVWDGDGGTKAWGMMVTLTSVFVGLVGALLGLVLNGVKTHRFFLALFIFVGGVSGATLILIKPEPSYAIPALFLVGVGSFCIETSFVPYNTLLRIFVPQERAGRTSALAWGLGYVGGVLCLLFALVLIQSGFIPEDDLLNVRLTNPLAAGWLLLFGLPIVIALYKLPKKSLEQPGYAPVAPTKDRIMRLLKYRGMWRFLLSRLFLAEGLTALFTFGGILAASIFGFSTEEVLLFAIALNISAGVGSIPGGFLDDRFGPRFVILISLVGLILSGIVIGVTEDKLTFWIVSIFLGLFIGPVQSAGRSLVAKSVQMDEAAQLYGLLGFSGRAVSFIGPLLVTVGIAITGNDKTAVWIIVGLITVSLFVMLSTPKSLGHIDESKTFEESF
jgi:UMF1 family MFS transporter